MWPDVRWHVPIRWWAGPRHLPLLSSLFADHIFPGQLQVAESVLELYTNLSNTSTNISLSIVLLRVPENFRSQENWNTWLGNTLSELLNRWASQFVKDLSPSRFGHNFQYQSFYPQNLGKLWLLAVTDYSGQWKMDPFIAYGCFSHLRTCLSKHCREPSY